MLNGRATRKTRSTWLMTLLLYYSYAFCACRMNRENARHGVAVTPQSFISLCACRAVLVCEYKQRARRRMTNICLSFIRLSGRNRSPFNASRTIRIYHANEAESESSFSRSPHWDYGRDALNMFGSYFGERKKKHTMRLSCVPTTACALQFSSG